MTYKTDSRVEVLELSNDPTVIVVNSLDDLPAPSGNVRTLADNAVYIISGQITLANDESIATGLNTVLMGYNRSRDAIIGNVAGSLLSVPTTRNSLKVTDLGFVQNNAGGTVIGTVDDTISRLEMQDVSLSAAGGGNIGTIGGNSLSFRRFSCSGFTAGLTLSATGKNTFVIDGAAFFQADGSGGDACIDLGSSTWNVIRLDNMTLSTDASGFGLSGVAANANFSSSAGRGTVRGCRFVGAGTPLENITIDDLQWSFTENGGVGSTVALGSYSMEGNSTVTSISAVDTYTVIAGTTVAGEEKHFEHTGSNQLTFRGLDPSFTQIFVTLSVSKSGAAKACEFAIFVNGSQAGPAIIREVTSTTGSLALMATATLVTDDVIDVRVQNIVDDDDITVESLSVIARGTL